MDLELIGQRDDDLPACHAAQLVERAMDGISVLEYVERDDDVRAIVGDRDVFVEIGDDVRRWMNVQADIPAECPSSARRSG